MTPDTAVRLEAVIGSTAETRLALQAAHDLWEARKGVNVKGLKKRTGLISDQLFKHRAEERFKLRSVDAS